MTRGRRRRVESSNAVVVLLEVGVVETRYFTPTPGPTVSHSRRNQTYALDGATRALLYYEEYSDLTASYKLVLFISGGGEQNRRLCRDDPCQSKLALALNTARNAAYSLYREEARPARTNRELGTMGKSSLNPINELRSLRGC